MDKLQADAVAQAILEPDLKFQEELRRRRAAGERDLARLRKVAWFVLGGAAAGTFVAVLAGVKFTIGALWGGIAGAAIGWLLVAWRRYRAVTSGRPEGE